MAADGLCEDEGEPCRGADWVAVLGEIVASTGVVVEMLRRNACKGWRRADRRQRVQIIVVYELTRLAVSWNCCLRLS